MVVHDHVVGVVGKVVVRVVGWAEAAACHGVAGCDAVVAQTVLIGTLKTKNYKKIFKKYKFILLLCSFFVSTWLDCPNWSVRLKVEKFKNTCEELFEIYEIKITH